MDNRHTGTPSHESTYQLTPPPLADAELDAEIEPVICPECGVNELPPSRYPGFKVLRCVPCAWAWVQARMAEKATHADDRET